MKYCINIFKIFFQVYFLFVLTWYNPFSFTILGSPVLISLDILMLYFVVQSFYLSRPKLIFLGCFLGFLIDLDLESSLIGINCFFMSIAAYFLSLVKINSSNWTDFIKYSFIFLICIILHINKYLFYNYELSFSNLGVGLINCLIILGTLIVLNKVYFKGKLV